MPSLFPGTASRRIAARAEKIDLGGSAGKIAIVYAEGEIVDGSGNEQNYIWGDKLARKSGCCGRTKASRPSCSA